MVLEKGLKMVVCVFVTAECCRTYPGMSFPVKLRLCMGQSGPTSNTWFSRPTGVQVTNGILIRSAVFEQITAEGHYALQ